MAEEDIKMMMLSPLNAETLVLPGSSALVANCGHRCVISPSGRSFLAADPEVYTLCLDCAQQDNNLIEQSHEQYLVPGAKKELIEQLGVAGLDQVLAAARRAGFIVREEREH